MLYQFNVDMAQEYYLEEPTPRHPSLKR